MKATYKNTLDEFNAERKSITNTMDSSEVIRRISLLLIFNDFAQKDDEDPDGIQKFRQSQAHMSLIHQYLNQIRGSLRSITEKYAKNAEDFLNIENTLE